MGMESSIRGADDRNIAKRSFKAAGGVIAAQFVMQFVQILLGVCMVRILTPEDYGTIGMISIFWAVGDVFVGGGFGQALIQRKEITETDLCSVFCYNILVSLACCGLMTGFAGKIALFYGIPVLKPMVLVMAWTLPIKALASVQSVLLARQLKQPLITTGTLVSQLSAGLVALFLAWRGLGVWALVWQQVTAAALFTLILFLFVRWVPKPMFSFKALASLFKFGSNLLAVGLLDAFVMNFTNMVLGRRDSARTLGFYSRTVGYVRLWPYSVQGAIAGVLFPAFSKIQDDPFRLLGAFRRALAVSSFAVVFPTLLLCALCKPIVLLVLGGKWLPCVHYWRLITASAVFFPIQMLNVQLLKAVGRSDLYLLLEILKKSLYAVQITVLIVWGIVPMLVCEIAVSILCVCMNSYFTGRSLHYGTLCQLRDFSLYAAISVPACLAAWGVYRAVSPVSPWSGLALALFAGPAVYLALNRLFKTPALVELVGLAGGRFPVLKKIFRC